MQVTDELVRALADLAELELSSAEVARMRRDLEAVLGYVERIAELDTSAVPPTAHALELATPLRPDEAGDPLPVGEVVRMAPEHGRDALVVPKVLE
jgi:aspartyl-tRNA(Asn)/glutamyl-tRNA(Gln) amidotransferase subunit C